MAEQSGHAPASPKVEPLQEWSPVVRVIGVVREWPRAYSAQTRVQNLVHKLIIVHLQVQCEIFKILKLRNNCFRRGSVGRACAIQVSKMCGAEGTTHFSHFDCAISAPRPPPDTTFAPFFFIVAFIYLFLAYLGELATTSVIPP